MLSLSYNTIKLKRDGCSKGNLGSTREGGLIRDENGILILGFSLKIGWINSVLLENYDSHVWLTISLEYGIERVLVEIGSFLIIKC